MRHLHPVAVDVGVSVHNATSEADTTHSVLALNGRDVPRHVRAIYAVIDHPDAIAEQIADVVARHFARGGPADHLPKSQYGASVSGMLDVFKACYGRANIALAIDFGDDTLVFVSGECAAYIQTGLRLERMYSADVGAQTPATSIVLNAGGRIVLASGALRLQLGEHELQTTIQASGRDYTVQEQATWLTALAASRGVQQAIALVLAPDGASTGESRHETFSRSMVAGALGGAAAVIALGVGIHVARSSPPSPAVASLAAPNALSATIARDRHVTLAWRPVAHASSYVVQIGHRRYTVAGSRFALLSGVVPHQTYAWTVRARQANHIGPESSQASFTVPAATRARRASLRLSVNARLGGGALQLCWSVNEPVSRVDVVVNGPYRSQRQSVAPWTDLSSWQDCRSMSVKPGRSYVWRLGVVPTVGQERWTSWGRVRTAAQHHVSRPVHHVRRSNPIASPAQRPPVSVALASPAHVSGAAAQSVASTARVSAVQGSSQQPAARPVSQAPTTHVVSQAPAAPRVSQAPSRQTSTQRTTVSTAPRVSAVQPAQPVRSSAPRQSQPAYTAPPRQTQPTYSSPPRQTQPSQPVSVPVVQPTPAPAAPQPAPTSPVISCPTPPNCS